MSRRCLLIFPLAAHPKTFQEKDSAGPSIRNGRAILKGSLLALFQTLDGFESAIEVYGEAFLFLPELVAHYAIVFYLVLLEEFSKPHLVTIKSSAFIVHKG